MEAQHTPGPWVSGDGMTTGRLVSAPNVTAKARRNVAHVGGPDREANARLIAAAPDLLDALQNLENDDGSIPYHAWALVQAAISKATGGAP